MSAPTRRLRSAVLMLSVVSSACGRFAFDEPKPNGPEVTPPDVAPPAAAWYLGPEGDDRNPGTRELPWRTFSHGLAQLGPGQTLMLLDGEYPGTKHGDLQVNCATGTTCAGAACANGQAGQPITVRAEHARQAILRVNEHAQILTCNHWVIDGLTLIGRDVEASIYDVISVEKSNVITLQNLLVSAPNRYRNSKAVAVGNSRDVLIADTEVYDFHRYAFVAAYSSRVTFRRIYGHSRSRADIPGGYATPCPAGDGLLDSWYSSSITIENAVAEDTCDGVVIVTGTEAGGSASAGDDHWIGGSLFRTSQLESRGIAVQTDCVQCTAAQRSDSLVISNVIFDGHARGVVTQAADAQINSVTHVASARAEAGLEASSNGAGHTVEATLVGWLSVFSKIGVVTTGNAASANVVSANFFDVTTNTVRNGGPIAQTQAYATDPMLGTCRSQLPAASPMRTISSAGRIGADLRYQTVDRVETATPLWNPGFPCGATVSGINDSPNTSCIGVHLRAGLEPCP